MCFATLISSSSQRCLIWFLFSDFGGLGEYVANGEWSSFTHHGQCTLNHYIVGNKNYCQNQAFEYCFVGFFLNVEIQIIVYKTINENQVTNTGHRHTNPHHNQPPPCLTVSNWKNIKFSFICEWCSFREIKYLNMILQSQFFSYDHFAYKWFMYRYSRAETSTLQVSAHALRMYIFLNLF